jgi:nucleoside-diphosphate-sugar epimerase
MKTIVVGASGYIGKPLLVAARSQGSAVGTSSLGGDGLLPLRLECADQFGYGFISAGDVVLLTAAISEPDVYAREPDRARAVNVLGTSTFIERAIVRGARVVFFSTDVVYGEAPMEIDESASCNPVGGYAASKHEVETRFFGNSAFKSLRLSYVFSRDDRFTRYLINSVETRTAAEIFHPISRAVVHRGDVVAAAVALVHKWDDIPGNIINIGGPAVIARTKFAEIIRDVALPRLDIVVREPGAEFFTNRPRVVAMRSPLIPGLLGRSARPLADAVRLEFGIV